MLHVGEHIYGVVDQVPGVMHVGTRILHFNFLPCAPLGSVVVVEKQVAGEKTVVKTRLSVKSVVVAYLRFALLWGGIILASVGFTLYDAEKMVQRNPPPWFQSPGVWVMTVGALSILAWWVSHRLTYASYHRAIELADLIGLDREHVDASFRTRGLPIGDEAFASTPLQPAEEKDDVFRLE